MRVLSCVFMLLAALAASAGGVVAQSLLDLTGRYRCVHLCRGGVVGDTAFITQNGREMNLLNEAGEPSRGWIEGNGRIWAQAWNEGAVFSPDGAIIQFDRGTIWQRDLGEALEPALRGRRQVARRVAPAAPVTSAAPAERTAVSPATYDGSWSVVISTRNGGCDPEYRFGIEIVDGHVVYGGGAGVAVQGNVGPNGGVQVSVSSGGQRADGQGRLSRNAGAGTWTGQGPAGVCAGVWQAARRG